ncbi:hypothetical protein V3564_04765 [Bartonella sp. B12(2025)]
MNTKSHTTKQIKHDNPPFVVEKKERMGTPIEVTMSDITKKLRSVYAQMQMKYSPHHLASQSSMEESFKSYLDDISRAILAEHYIRRQKEKKLFEHLEQIKTLVQSLHNEKKSLEEAAVTRRMPRFKSSDSVVRHLAHMACEENKERSSFQELPSFLRQNSITPIHKNVESVLQQGNKSSLPIDAMKPSLKEAEKFVEHSAIEEKRSDVQASDRCIENEKSSSLKAKLVRVFFFLRYSVKKFFLCFLTIVFMTAITLCLYVSLRGVRFF